MSNQYNTKNQQRLYWAFSKPLRWLGLTVDEWAIVLSGVFPGLFFLNSQHGGLGLVFMVGGIVLCCLSKKFKKVSEHFLIKSYMLSKGWWMSPSKQYPNMLNKRVGK